jgi:hypothetical protein
MDSSKKQGFAIVFCGLSPCVATKAVTEQECEGRNGVGERDPRFCLDKIICLHKVLFCTTS